MVDWQPLIAAAALLITAVAAGVPGLMIALRNHATLTRVEAQTNSRLTAAMDRIATLEAQLAAVRRPGP
jgi:hypothetical protein